MTVSFVAPDCLAGPQPEVRIFAGDKRIFPCKAGYRLKPHIDYRIEVTVRGVDPDKWRIATPSHRPGFIQCADAREGTAATKYVRLRTHSAAAGWISWLTGFGADLALTVKFDAPEIKSQQVIVPLASARTWGAVLLIVLTLVPSLVFWLLTEKTPEAVAVYLPEAWFSRVLIALLAFAAMVLLLSVYRWCILPSLRYRQLRRHSKRRLAS